MSIGKIAGLVSTLALLMAITAYSEAHASSTTDVSTTAQIKADTKDVIEKTKDSVSNAADKISDKTSGTYESFKAKMFSEKNDVSDVTIQTRMTAKGLLDQPVHNAAGDKVGTLKDIILDHTGKPQIVVVSDGGFMGVGDKLAAFDAALVLRQDADGDVLMPLSENAVAKVSAFSYDPKDASESVHVIPADGYSVSDLMKGKLIDPKNDSLGSIENITFSAGQASSVIVAFDQVAGAGGEKIAFSFDDLAIAKNGDGNLNLRMGTQQAARFEEYKKMRTTK